MRAQNRPTFTYFGHSTIRCDFPTGEVVLIDPWVAQNPACPDELKKIDKIDVMLITHAHFDHCADAVDLAKEHKPLVIGTFELCAWLESKGVENCSGMNIGGTQKIPGGKVTQVQALHTSSFSQDDGPIGDHATGYMVTLDSGYTFYHAGDTTVFMDMQLFADDYRPALAFLPIGDHFTMNPRQAARACRFLQVRQVIPIHWGTFPLLTGTPAALKEELANHGVNTEMIALNPGEQY